MTSVDWPGLANAQPQPLPRPEVAVYGKLDGASTDYRWLAGTSGVLADLPEFPLQLLDIGDFERAGRAWFWGWWGSRFVLVSTRPTNASDGAGRPGRLLFRVVLFPEAPAVPPIVLGVWGALWLEGADEDYGVELAKDPKFSSREHVACISPPAPTMVDVGSIVERGRIALRARLAGQRAGLVAMYAGIEEWLAAGQPADRPKGEPLGALFVPEGPPSLAELLALLLPLTPEQAFRLSVAGWSFSRTRPLASRGSTWDIWVAPIPGVATPRSSEWASFCVGALFDPASTGLPALVLPLKAPVDEGVDAAESGRFESDGAVPGVEPPLDRGPDMEHPPSVDGGTSGGVAPVLERPGDRVVQPTEPDRALDSPSLQSDQADDLLLEISAGLPREYIRFDLAEEFFGRGLQRMLLFLVNEAPDPTTHQIPNSERPLDQVQRVFEAARERVRRGGVPKAGKKRPHLRALGVAFGLGRLILTEWTEWNPAIEQAGGAEHAADPTSGGVTVHELYYLTRVTNLDRSFDGLGYDLLLDLVARHTGILSQTPSGLRSGADVLRSANAWLARNSPHPLPRDVQSTLSLLVAQIGRCAHAATLDRILDQVAIATEARRKQIEQDGYPVSR